MVDVRTEFKHVLDFLLGHDSPAAGALVHNQINTHRKLKAKFKEDNGEGDPVKLTPFKQLYITKPKNIMIPGHHNNIDSQSWGASQDSPFWGAYVTLGVHLNYGEHIKTFDQRNHFPFGLDRQNLFISISLVMTENIRTVLNCFQLFSSRC